MYVLPRKGFTLIELLVVIAIIAILAVVVVLTLNPAALLQQGRDSNRVSDMDTLTHAISLYEDDQGGSLGYSLGNASSVYISIPDATISGNTTSTCSSLGLPVLPTGYSYQCSSPQDYKNVNGTGWIPINFTKMSTGAPIGDLPVDPTNQTSSKLFYTYQANGSQYETTAVMESQKYLGTAASDGGTYADLYEKGSSLSLALMNYGGSGLTPQGWWRFANSTNLGLDSSSQGNTLTVNGSISQVAGPNAYVPEAVSLNGASSQYFSIPNSSLSTGFPGKSGQESFTVGEWVNPATSTNGTMMETLVEGCTFSLDFAGGGYPLFQIDDNSWAGHQAVGTVTVPMGTWSQIVGVWNQSTGALQIYFNGVNVTASPASSTTAVVNGFPLTIGEPSTCNVNNYYTGAIAEPFVIAAALTAAQVQNIYNYGVIDL